jgi:hypothetical protein
MAAEAIPARWTACGTRLRSRHPHAPRPNFLEVELADLMAWREVFLPFPRVQALERSVRDYVLRQLGASTAVAGCAEITP